MFKIEVRRFDFSNETAGMMGHFGRDPFSFTKNEARFLWRTQRLPRFFVLDKEARAAGQGWCSVCRRFGDLKSKRNPCHKDKVACPHCGEALVVEHVWRMSKRICDRSLIYQWRRSKAEPGALLCRAVEVIRRWGADGYDAVAWVMGFYVFRPGDGGWGMDCRHGVYKVRRRTGYLDDLYMGNLVHIADDWASLRKAAKGSPLRYGMEEYRRYQRDHFLRFFDWSDRYSSIEKLLKMGLGRLVADRMVRDPDGSGGAVYWGGKTVEKIFRGKLTKADKRFLLTDGDCVNQSNLVVWQFFRGKRSIKEVVEGKEGMTLSMYTADLKRIARHVDGMRVMAYLKKQGEKRQDRQDQWPLNIRTYADYLADAAKLSLNFKDKNVLFPKDLFRAHQNTLRQVKYKENAALEATYAKKRRGEMEKRYSFSAMGMKIVVPEVLSDLIVEGKAQHTCVGGYMERVAKGETDVVFVRREGDLDVPYITMEIHNQEIFQARGKNNGAPDAAGRAFIEAFEAAKLTKKEERARITA